MPTRERDRSRLAAATRSRWLVAVAVAAIAHAACIETALRPVGGVTCAQVAAQQGWKLLECEVAGNLECRGLGIPTKDCDFCCEAGSNPSVGGGGGGGGGCAAHESCAPPSDDDCDGVPCGEPHSLAGYSGNGDLDITSVGIDAGGNVYFAGSFSGTTDFGCGAIAPKSEGKFDAFIVMRDKTGKCVWNRSFGDVGDDYAGKLAIGKLGKVHLPISFGGTITFGNTYTSAGFYDVVLLTMDSAGNFLWGRQLGGAGNDLAVAAAAADNEEVLVLTNFDQAFQFEGVTQANAGKSDVFVAWFDGKGTALAGKRYGGAANDSGRALAAAPNGDAVLTGVTEGAIDFGYGTNTAGGGGDLFVARVRRMSGGLPGWSAVYGDDKLQSGLGVALDAVGGAVVVAAVAGVILGTGQAARRAAHQERRTRRPRQRHVRRRPRSTDPALPRNRSKIPRRPERHLHGHEPRSRRARHSREHPLLRQARHGRDAPPCEHAAARIEL